MGFMDYFFKIWAKNANMGFYGFYGLTVRPGFKIRTAVLFTQQGYKALWNRLRSTQIWGTSVGTKTRIMVLTTEEEKKPI